MISHVEAADSNVDGYPERQAVSCARTVLLRIDYASPRNLCVPPTRFAALRRLEHGSTWSERQTGGAPSREKIYIYRGGAKL